MYFSICLRQIKKNLLAVHVKLKSNSLKKKK